MYNNMLTCDSTALRKVFEADYEKHARIKGCWTAQMLDGFQCLGRCADFVQAV
jgi:hypothetical protein